MALFRRSSAAAVAAARSLPLRSAHPSLALQRTLPASPSRWAVAEAPYSSRVSNGMPKVDKFRVEGIKLEVTHDGGDLFPSVTIHVDRTFPSKGLRVHISSASVAKIAEPIIKSFAAEVSGEIIKSKTDASVITFITSRMSLIPQAVSFTCAVVVLGMLAFSQLAPLQFREQVDSFMEEMANCAKHALWGRCGETLKDAKLRKDKLRKDKLKKDKLRNTALKGPKEQKWKQEAVDKIMPVVYRLASLLKVHIPSPPRKTTTPCPAYREPTLYDHIVYGGRRPRGQDAYARGSIKWETDRRGMCSVGRQEWLNTHRRY